MRRRLHRMVGLAAALAAVVGLMSVAPVATVTASAATSESGSALTVKWAGGNDPEIQKYQTDHAAITSDGKGKDNGSGHWDDFKNLSVTVSKTKNLGDEAIKITATGMAPTSLGCFTDDGGCSANYLQIMQCWGTDPLASDFYQTCQFGATGAGSTARGSGNRVAENGARGRAFASDPFDNRAAFRAVTGERSKAFSVQLDSGPSTVNGTTAFFSTSTTNELPSVPLDSRGATEVNFEVQSAGQQPYLGCGAPAPSGAGERCWLVIVPRGSHSNELSPGVPLKCGPSYYVLKPWGEISTGGQLGSPIDPECAAWRDRVAVPLDFTATTQSCAVGASERRAVGTELIAAAFSSWQPALCGLDGGGNFALTTSSGDLTRSQLLTGQASMAIVSRALTNSTIGSVDSSLLENANLRYAPLANTGLGIAFVMNDSITPSKSQDVATSLRLTPRLIAKAITQSYSSDVPQWDSQGNWRNEVLHTYWPHQVESICFDPEWIALGNPPSPGGRACTGSFYLIGPQGDDSIALLWNYLQSDADASAFLNGAADPWGNTINPYYLPASNVDAKNGGLGAVDISRHPIDRFLRADQTLGPADPPYISEEQFRLTGGQKFDATAFSPYSQSFAANVVRILKTDSKRIYAWDLQKLSGSFVVPGWATSGATDMTMGRAAFGPVDIPTAQRYNLRFASLAAPLGQTTSKGDVASARTFVSPTDESMSSALSAQRSDPDTGVASTDFAALPGNAYPLTMTLYGAVDVTSSTLDGKARTEYATLIDYASGAGNVRGEARGQLPAGYVPLTEAQKAQSAKAVADLLHPPTAGTAPTNNGDTPTGPASSVASASSPASAAASTAQTTTRANSAVASSATSAAAVPLQGLLGGLLVAGLLGAMASPFVLYRRRGAP